MPLPPPQRQKQIIAQAAAKYGINPAILYGVYGAETSFGHNLSTSPTGAQGPFQFEPGTARSLGINPNDFTQAAFGAARYLSQYKGRGTAGMLAAYNAGPAGSPNNPETRAYIPRVEQLAKGFGGGFANVVSAPGAPPQTPQTQVGVQTKNVVDQAGFDKAQKEYALGQILRNQPKSPFDIGPKSSVSSENPLLSVLPTAPPTSADFMQAHSTLAQLAGGTKVQPHPSTPSGVTTFQGKQVAAWIAPALAWAKQHGWSGTVQSGYRSYAAQAQIYNSGVRPAAKPGTSNHEGTTFPRGAVDVSNAQQLSQILAKSPYAGQLVWAGTKDPVHFSHPHGGSY